MVTALALLGCGDFFGPNTLASEPPPLASEPAALGGEEPPAEPSTEPDVVAGDPADVPTGGEGGAGEPPAGEGEPGAAAGAPPDEGSEVEPGPMGPPDEPPSAPEPSPPAAPPPASGGSGGSAGAPNDPGSGGAGGAGGAGSNGEGNGASGGGGASGDGGASGGGDDEEPEDEEPEEEDEEEPEEDEPEDEEPEDEEDEEPEEDEPEGDLQPSFHLAVLGSSTAAGEGASAGRGWVALLESSLERSARFTVSNFAVGGYTTEELLPGSGVRGNLTEAIADEPDLIVVALAGSNDQSRGTSTGQFFSRLNTLRARVAGIPMFFVGTAPKDISDSEREQLLEWSLGMEEEFSSCWVPVGDGEHSPCFIDIFSVLATSSLGLAPQYGSGDGIHLNDAGHAAIYRVAEPVIRQYVCSVTRCR